MVVRELLNILKTMPKDAIILFCCATCELEYSTVSATVDIQTAVIDKNICLLRD